MYKNFYTAGVSCGRMIKKHFRAIKDKYIVKKYMPAAAITAAAVFFAGVFTYETASERPFGDKYGTQVYKEIEKHELKNKLFSVNGLFYLPVNETFEGMKPESGFVTQVGQKENGKIIIPPSTAGEKRAAVRERLSVTVKR